MSRLEVKMPAQAQAVIEQIYSSMERRIDANPPGLCPVDMTLNFLNLCQAQTCGKCVPCRIGLDQLSLMIREVLDGNPDPDILDRIKTTAQVVVDSADCAIGIDAGQLILNALVAFRDDFEEHVKTGRCLGGLQDAIPCVAQCPAAVDIPGYVALVNEGRCADAIKLIRKDNPFPVSCAYICEHPCENHCRRKMVDGAINIRGLKRYAVDMAGDVENPACAEATGKTVAVVGGGPSGLTAAYYLALMGHKVTVYDMHKKLGGMMRYGIPSYRYPREKLDGEIASILSLGIEAHTETKIGVDISFEELKNNFDAVYVAIGAHTDKKVGIEGEDAKGVVSAVEMLRGIGNDEMPDFTGKNVVVIGGGNVAMDCTRSAVRLGAKFVTCVYRRRQEDMTAQAEEVEGAIAEGAEVLTLHAPVKIEVDAEGNATALWAQPQIIGEVDKAGRPRPNTASAEPIRIPADVVIVAIGQAIEYQTFEAAGIKTKWGNLVAGTDTKTAVEGIFSGGDCVTGPATVIRAIAAGKAAAANIDEYLGFKHEIKVDVEVPTPSCADLRPRGRINCRERAAAERKNDFVCMEHCMTCEEATKESSRCLRCDHFGYGIFKGGRVDKW